MLDSATKGRIDSARDILVGKVPDPKSQVEQITIALIYKFMYDMDRQSEELGGKPSFFTGEFKKHRWSQLLDKRLSGHERLILYAEGIERMNQNKKIPQLFRDIFKGVFLPYRDPETLNLFLKEIDGFSYEHSERLGDAFEYLLSVLGTQGAAGQFRTPRHIIDFIVAVVDPKKNETVLDPACGTAGFLISSFKHILHTSSNRQSQTGNRQPELTPDERARLMTNFRGYDIAPDMVRLSRANLYLHGFPNPVIHEYDTLTSEERWDERCDVILANPPFMTPKGGIRPHKRFSIKAKRSEVLFVDYIAEHLNPGGRAGIIVPEGIIFQSQNAYKALRKMLVENYLWAAVSLPAGVFNPYAGVKTTVLFLDRNLAKRADDVLFVKVESDGFDLGAQRRPIGQNDLPVALKTLCEFKTNGSVNRKSEIYNQKILTVSRKRLLESSDINLSGERYRVAVARLAGNYPMVKLADICAVIAGQSPDGSTYNDRGIGMPFHQGKTEFGDTFVGEAKHWTTAPARIAESCDIVMSVRAPVGPINIVRERVCIGRGLAAIRPNPSTVKSLYLFHLLRGLESKIVGSHGASFSSINRSEIEDIEIPLPPLAEQEKIVAELEGYRKVIEGARQILQAHRPSMPLDAKWLASRLGDVAEVDGRLVDPKLPRFAKLPHVSAENIESGTGRLMETRSAAEDKMTSGKYLFGSGCVLYSKLRPYLRKVAIAPFRGLCSADMYPLRSDPRRLIPEFLLWILLSEEFTAYADSMSHRARMPKLNRDQLMAYETRLPSLKIQRQIVKELKVELGLVGANRELITRMEAKIQAKLSEVWGESNDAA